MLLLFPATVNFPALNARQRLLSALTLIALCTLSQLSAAQQYKYQDENGRWHYSDTPPAGVAKVETIDEQVETRKETEKDLNKSLTEKFKPVSIVEKNTLAVMKIETPAGTGSGFFISSNGYIVTNKHVVRPGEQALSRIKRDLEKAEKVLENQRARLSRQRAQLKDMKRHLERRIADLEYYPETEQKVQEKEIAQYRRQYLESKKNVDKFRRAVATNTRKHNDEKASINRRVANAAVANRFTLVLKDETKLQANLVKLSDKQDLALLKLDGYTTPRIDIRDSHRARQGQSVFAIGSPLGNNDYVTSGVVTSIKRETIITDAQILPGNSGGPLIDDEGLLLGVNTAKMLSTSSIGSEGFGIAIPLATLKSEFPDAFDPAHNQIAQADNAINDNDIAEVIDEPASDEPKSLLDSIMEDYRNSP